MAEPKTKSTKASVDKFIASLPENVRQDTLTIVDMMKQVTGAPPKLWGSAIIGFGLYRYTYASGKTGDWPRIGMSPRKQNLTIYIMPGFDKFEVELSKLGKHKMSKSCLYIKRLADVHQPTLKSMMKKSIAMMKEKYPEL